MKTDAFLLRLYEGATEQSLDRFDDDVFALLRQQVHFDSGAIVQTRVRPDLSLDPCGLALFRTPIERWGERTGLDVPDPGLSRALRHQGNVVLTPYRELHAYSGAFKRYLLRYDVAHALTYVAPHAPGDRTDIVALWRAVPRQRPGVGEQRRLDALMPHVMRARAIAARLGSGGRTVPDSLTLMADRHGIVQALGDAARALLALEWPAWSGPLMPAPLWQALCASSTLRYQGRRIRVRAERQVDLLVVHVDRVAPAELLLTPAERRLADLVAMGATYKDAARTLGISPATVRNQLHSAYAKLGIPGRRQLAAALAR